MIQKLLPIFEDVEQGIIILDDKFKILYVNPSIQKILKINLEYLVNHSIEEIIIDTEKEKFRKKGKITEEFLHNSLIFRDNFSQSVAFNIKITYLKSQDSIDEYLVILLVSAQNESQMTNRDITEMHKAFNILSKNLLDCDYDQVSLRIHELFELISLFFQNDESVIYFFDPVTSEAYLKYFWIKKDIVEEKPVVERFSIKEFLPDFKPKSFEYFYKPEFDQFILNFKNAPPRLLKIKTALFVPFMYQDKLYGLMGICNLIKNTQWNLELINNLKIISNILASVIVFKDIQHNLTFSEQKYRILFESSPNCIMIIDKDLTIYECNQSAEIMLELNRKDIIHKKYTEIMKFVDFFAKNEEAVLKYLSEKKNIKYSGIKFINLKGKEYYVNLQISFIDIEKRKMILVVSQDITKEKINELELLESKIYLENLNKELEAFSFSISHELKAPLRRIEGFSKILVEELKQSKTIINEDYFNRIIENVKIMRNRIEGLLRLAKISQMQLQKEKINVSEDVKKILQEYIDQDPNRSVKLKIQPNVEAVADPELLSIVLENLIDNAWKFTSKQVETYIEFGFYRKKGENVYFIKDNGIGFNINQKDETQKKRLFGLFETFHGNNEFQGNGLGLATVKRIIHKHNGWVWAESKINNGATFYFSLPDN